MRFFVAYVFAVFTAFTAVAANAEITTLLWSDMEAQMAHELNGGSSSAGGWFRDDPTNTSIYLTGGSAATYTVNGGSPSNPFGYNASGLATVSSLADSPYTALQQAQIQSLYDHVYYKAYNEDRFTPGEIIKDGGYANVLACALDIILYSTTPNSPLSLTQWEWGGDFYYADTSLGWLYFNSEDAVMITEWFDAINNNSWNLLDGYDENRVELTSYDIQFQSAPPAVMAYALEMNDSDNDNITHVKMFAVERSNNVSATPEPATMLIFGLGIAGLGFARRRMNRK